ncbi:hypothetical protein ABIE13_000327 [Ottowia thiooxydans]|uniref:Uncharacterized protein n=1 Tax=Ottowia thiooxydans TaxID=219182 RepID=A0ABV2Q2I5_9BURK
MRARTQSLHVCDKKGVARTLDWRVLLLRNVFNFHEEGQADGWVAVQGRSCCRTRATVMKANAFIDPVIGNVPCWRFEHA